MMDTNKDFHGTRHNWVKRELDLRRNQPHIYKEQRSIMVGASSENIGTAQHFGYQLTHRSTHFPS